MEIERERGRDFNEVVVRLWDENCRSKGKELDD